ncbi:MAG: hypothetical protein HKO64_12065 [Xanthomonadales bacterium]|nr:hypothetical protein [Gammaproteobacteria bacterium]NNE04458.1 hypothetical protein [Xanthomonadales bacterium]NNL96348.1 hypothetical protein [Xanthomonadales bacterium]
MKLLPSMTCFVFLSMAASASAQTATEDSDDASQAEPEVAASAEQHNTEDSVEASAAVEEATPGTEDEPVALLDQPLDGSSVETFQAGLDRVEKEAGEEEYRQLMSSISFLLFYDLGAKRDKATLYSRLDGKSPNEIIAKVQNHRAGKR